MAILRDDIPLAWATRPRARSSPSPELEWRYGLFCYIQYEDGRTIAKGTIRSDTSASRTRPGSAPYPPIPLAWANGKGIKSKPNPPIPLAWVKGKGIKSKAEDVPPSNSDDCSPPTQEMIEANVFIGHSDRALFGLSENATAREVNTAYRRLARLTHPDKNGSTAEAKGNFQCMKTRYEALKVRMAACRRSCEKEMQMK
jgi:hypothetical protein